MLDKLFINCTYPDFKAGEMKKGAVGIKEGRIEFVSSKPNDCYPESKETIDVKGNIISPGFIDIHMHEEDFLKEGYRYIVANMLLRQGVTTCVGGNCGNQRQRIKIFREGIDKLEGSPVNYMMLAGYNTIRSDCGVELYETPTENQKLQIKESILEEIENGAAGISFGLEYGPGITMDEMINAVDLLEDKGALVAAHYRHDSRRSIESIKEMIQLQNSIENPFQISHLSSCSAMEQMEEALEIINDAMAKDPRLNYDTYPYNAFSARIGTEVFAEGCFEEWNKSYDSIMLTDDPYRVKFCDEELFYKARREYPDMYAVAFVMEEPEIELAIVNANGMIASDATIFNGHGHPRAGGTFARVLGKYVREQNSLSLYDALRKMTILPAERMRLHQKGRIEVGCDADLVVFDKDEIIDKSTFEGILPPEGIIYVYVSGEVAVKGKEVVNEGLGEFMQPGR